MQRVFPSVIGDMGDLRYADVRAGLDTPGSTARKQGLAGRVGGQASDDHRAVSARGDGAGLAPRYR
ncbi:MAG: hypothetical protein U5K75_06945 [Ahrensia sp.]|nr:hypothetical protein [Ahrensia sp.]